MSFFVFYLYGTYCPMSWFSNISNTIGSIMEVMAPMPEEQQKLEIIQKVQEERRDSTAGVGARLVAQRALGTDSPFQSPLKSQQLVNIRNSSNVGNTAVKTPTVSIQTNISNFSKNNEMKINTNNNYSTPSPSLNYSSNTPLSPFLKPTAVPETIVQQAGDAAIVTAQYLQANLKV